MLNHHSRYHLKDEDDSPDAVVAAVPESQSLVAADAPDAADSKEADLSPVDGLFSPPAFLDDLSPEGKLLWSARISHTFSAVMLPDRTAFPRRQWYNPVDDPPPAGTTLIPAVIDWIAFPRRMQLDSPTDQARWHKADSSRSLQDEYLEWSVTRNKDGKITRVEFTCEGPEYWEALSEDSPDTVLSLYRQHINKEVQMEDLFQGGRYVPKNKWNNSTTNGAMHLVQRANTLGAEIRLAADATVIRRIDGADLTSPQDLIHCSKYGVPTRNSDPHIGSEVNKLARAGALITLSNPVGLYIGRFDVPGWVAPNDANPKSFWKVTRGTEANPVRAVYEVPASKGFVVGDIKIGGKNIEYGGQIVDFIRMRLTGVASRFDPKNNRAVADFCVA